ncbi:exo2 [[Candida] subhashii]|uniref:5'-3' exoribonuclease 1 n=1 Tax=[Candida] subhashii TaxID=561895 RepID=A0A8J5QIV1_9ASCO|nr:exo2 [[Candida] subhashii]KAG7662769.1 exo2 [[Candida] subhashii]
MGIPKFFRFVSERWPLISQLIEAPQIPEFDNLYLDMNSILHTCTHSNDGTITRLSDDQMYAAIFNYIDHLFQIIKPQKTFYMAIDGVAPRAKMNQQRARRFRTAYEAEENLKKAIENGEDIPKEDPFDSNSITPGTEFMAKLTNNLKYFIHKKITEDSRWANIEIILSGHEVPGEGEHKIMEFIRSTRSQDDYDPNTRHCIYGLDADLIMLGLVTHDSHVALLREEVSFGRQRASAKELHEQTFYLLHLSLLREYLALEFQELEGELTFELDFEKILDDFILIMYVIGNDFLPNLPDLFINKGAFPLLIATFKQALKNSDGYINEKGKINLKRLSIWIHYLAEFELENFEKQEVDVEWFNKRLEDISISGEKKRKRTGKLLILKDQKKLVGFIKPWLMEISARPVSEIVQLENEGKLPSLKLNNEDVERNLDFIREFALEAGILLIHSKSENTYVAKLDVDGLIPSESDDEYEERVAELRKTIKHYQSANLIETEDLLQESKDIYNEKFLSWKSEYYEDKLGFPITEREKLVELTSHYIEGLQWVLYYYYQGVPSWNWYYRYHYAPRISDIIVGLDEMIQNKKEITFEKSRPFKPFEQLMAVLPARSKKLMPPVYRTLMTDEKSPIISFYPHEVDIDMNGKTATWEAVVLLDFVDENKLVETLTPIEEKLTPEEKSRNSFGYNIKFIRNPQIDRVFPSPLPGFFHDIEHDSCYEEEYKLREVAEYKYGLIEGAKTGTELLAGFPTLNSIPFQAELLANECKVFNFPSRSESMVLTLGNVWEDLSVHQFAESFLGKIVYTRWPFLRESRVVKVEDGENKYELVKTAHGRKLITAELDNEEKRSYKSDLSYQRIQWDKTRGVKFGEIDGLVHVQPVSGLIRNPKGAYVKTYSKDIQVYPLQLVVKEVANKDERYATRPPLPIEEEFPLNSQVVFLGDMAYGCPATVVGYNDNKLSIKIFKIQSTAEPNIGKKRVNMENREIRYAPSFEVSKLVRISPLLLSRITSQFMIQEEKSKTNIGLELKFEMKKQKALGYTRKSANGRFWEFSPLAINMINTYKTKFPELFRKLEGYAKSNAMPKVSDISTPEEIKEVRKWLKEAKEDLILVSLESESLTKFSFQAIEQDMENYILNQIPTINKDIKGVPREAILNASESYQLLSAQRFDLGDRVVYVQDFGKVPILSKGTVASIITHGSKISLGIIFDQPLLSGGTMNGKLKTNRGLTIDSSLVLNLTNRQFVFHSQASRSRKHISHEEKIQRIKAAEARKQQQSVQKKQEVEQKTNEVLQKNSHELLSLLKVKKKGEDLKANEDNKEEGDTPGVSNPQAAKQIYGQIYSEVMNEGQQQQPSQIPAVVPVPVPVGAGSGAAYGVPFPPPPVPYGYIPVVPGIPLPPQFLQQQPQQQPYPFYGEQQGQESRPENAEASEKHDESNNRGPRRGGNRGQARGGSQRGHGRGRGGHRGDHRGGHRGGEHRGAQRGGHRGSTRGDKPKSEERPANSASTESHE